MKRVGIICEYNPFHNGHIYHLDKVKALFPDSLIILVMSGNFTQRGIPSIIDKWHKTEIALNHGIDLVVELPFVFATQSADIFAKGAIAILKELKAEYLVFGSEENNVNNLIKLANISLYNDDYQNKIKGYLDSGDNYPTALSKAFKEFNCDVVNTPNDLLGLCYIKAILKQKAIIEPITIKRTNNYHEEDIKASISSATSIRKACQNKINIDKTVPVEVASLLKESQFFQDNYFPFLKYKIQTTTDLSLFQTVDEGIENRIKKCINDVNSWDELVNILKTKRYTYNKINRMLVHILCNFTKEEAKKYQNIEYIRILGFSDTGKVYLNKVKKELGVPIVTTFSKNNSKMLELEMKTTCVYASILEENQKNYLIKSEYKNKPKMRED